jgi:hypothetical protein
MQFKERCELVRVIPDGLNSLEYKPLPGSSWHFLSVVIKRIDVYNLNFQISPSFPDEIEMRFILIDNESQPMEVASFFFNKRAYVSSKEACHP